VCSATPARQEAEIIEAQRREMDQMKQLIANLKNNPVSATAPDLPPPGRQTP
jgi:hypothetical protein